MPVRPSRVFPRCRLCVLVVRGTQVCVITSVIGPGYGPPASKWTLYPIQRCWQQRRPAPADYGFDDAARRLCFMGRYFWLRNNTLELFNLSRTMTCTICVWSHSQHSVCHICHVRDESILNKTNTICIYSDACIMLSHCDVLVTCPGSPPSTSCWCLFTTTLVISKYSDWMNYSSLC